MSLLRSSVYYNQSGSGWWLLFHGREFEGRLIWGFNYPVFFPGESAGEKCLLHHISGIKTPKGLRVWFPPVGKFRLFLEPEMGCGNPGEVAQPRPNRSYWRVENTVSGC